MVNAQLDDCGTAARGRDDVCKLVALREGARVVVAVARTTSEGQDFWCAHLVDEVALVGAVTADGCTGSRRHDHRPSPARSPRPRCIPMPPTPAVRHLGDESAASTGAFSGPGGTYLTAAEQGQSPVTRSLAAEQARGRLRDPVVVGRAAVGHG